MTKEKASTRQVKPKINRRPEITQDRVQNVICRTSWRVWVRASLTCTRMTVPTSVSYISLDEVNDVIPCHLTRGGVTGVTTTSQSPGTAPWSRSRSAREAARPVSGPAWLRGAGRLSPSVAALLILWAHYWRRIVATATGSAVLHYVISVNKQVFVNPLLSNQCNATVLSARNINRSRLSANLAQLESSSERCGYSRSRISASGRSTPVACPTAPSYDSQTLKTIEKSLVASKETTLWRASLKIYWLSSIYYSSS